MTTLRVYLDTSVISALDDARQPERARLTQDFWSRREDYELLTSKVANVEIERTRDETRRKQMLSRLAQVSVRELTPEMTRLAQRYLQEGIFAEAIEEDALHVAAAVLLGSDVLLSWNFKHLVNRRRRLAVAAYNRDLALPAIEIIAPPEL